MTTFPTWLPQLNGQYPIIWLDFVDKLYWEYPNVVSSFLTYFVDGFGAGIVFDAYGINTSLPPTNGSMPISTAYLNSVIANILSTQGEITFQIGWNASNLRGGAGGAPQAFIIATPQLYVGLPGSANTNLFELGALQSTLPNPPPLMAEAAQMLTGNVTFPAQKSLVASSNRPEFAAFNYQPPTFLFNRETDFLASEVTFDINAANISSSTINLSNGAQWESSFNIAPFPFNTIGGLYLGGQPSTPSLTNSRPTPSIQYFGIFGFGGPAQLNAAEIPLPPPRYAENPRWLFYPWDKGARK